MDGGPKGSDSMKTYALSGKIMLSAIVILFAIVIFMICLHLYARWYLIRSRRRQLRRRSRRRTHLVFYLEPNDPNAAAAAAIGAASRGLDAAVLSSLPVFVYSKAHPEALECAVCLSEFEENEKGRVLPKCNHYFHTDCIDMWFQSHSTCPLCRSPVEPLPSSQPEVVVSVSEPAETDTGGSSSGLPVTSQDGESVAARSTSSLCDRRKAFESAGVTIELPMRTDLEYELGPSSPASHGFKSPASRLLSLRRILSMNRKVVAVSPSPGVGTSCGPAAGELDIECGRDESTQPQNLVETPR